MADVEIPDEAPARGHKVTVPLVRCTHEARPGEETTPERLADILLEEEAEAALGSRERGSGHGGTI